MYISYKKKTTIPFNQVTVGEVFGYNGKVFDSKDIYLKIHTMPSEHNAVNLITNNITYIPDAAEVVLHPSAKLVIE